MYSQCLTYDLPPNILKHARCLIGDHAKSRTCTGNSIFLALLLFSAAPSSSTLRTRAGSSFLFGFFAVAVAPARIADDLKFVVAAVHHSREGLEVGDAVYPLDVLVRHAAPDDMGLAGDDG